MPRVQDHLRRTFLTGIFALVPIVVTAYIVYWIDERAGFITVKVFKHYIPVVGTVATILAIYIAGLLANATAGKMVLHYVDSALSKLPVFRTFYTSWKQVALTPQGTEGVFSHTVLVQETPDLWMIGFTSLRSIPSDPETICVLVFNAPTPTTGRMYFVKKDKCKVLEMSAEEAFKIILSAGNYVPTQIGEATYGH